MYSIIKGYIKLRSSEINEFKTKDKAAKKTEQSKPPTEIKIPVTELTKM